MNIYLVSGYKKLPKPHTWPITAFTTKIDATDFIANLVKEYPDNADRYYITLIDLVYPRGYRRQQKLYEDWLKDNSKDWSGLQEGL